MRKWSVAGLVVLFCWGLLASGTPPTPATARLSSRFSLQLTRDSAHAFLAEYHRTLRLVAAGKPIVATKMLMDTGGYSRTNVFKVSDSVFILRDAFDSYLVKLRSGSITQIESSKKLGGTFFGAFDEDAARNWRFISAAERKQLPATPSGG